MGPARARPVASMTTASNASRRSRSSISVFVRMPRRGEDVKAQIQRRNTHRGWQWSRRWAQATWREASRRRISDQCDVGDATGVSERSVLEALQQMHPLPNS